MKAAYCPRYGSPDVIEIRDIEKTTPKDNEILIKMRASAVTSGDARMRSFTVPGIFWLPSRFVFGLTKPKTPILGSQIAGDVEAIGSAVTKFKVGDAVYGATGLGMGANAEYLCAPEDSSLAIKPEKITYEEAAAIPFGTITAVYYMRDLGKVQSGEHVLIYGASGSVGVASVQIAKHLGATVTAVCSEKNAELMKSLGADHVIDYTQEDYAQSGKTYDVIMDAVGKTTFDHAKPVLSKNGRYLANVLDAKEIWQMLWTSMFSNQKVLGGPAMDTPEALGFVNELIEAGQVTPVVDRCFPLDEIVEAHRYVDSGRKRGNVIITMAGEN